MMAADENQKVPYDYCKVAMDLQKGLSTMQQEDTCTDFEVIVGRKSFRCHKVVLASVSDYFKAMFGSGMKETVQNQAIFEDISPEAFETVIDLIYPKTEMPDPLSDKDGDEMSELLRLAEMLQMQFLKKLCITFFQNTMAPSNCIERWKLGKEELCEELQKLSWEFLVSHFDDLAADEMLLSLDFDDFRSIIKDDFLKVAKEDVVWHTIKAWVKFDHDKRREHVAELTRHCCLTEIDPDYVLEEIVFDPIVRHDDEASMRVKGAVMYTRHKGVHGNQELKYREYMGKEQVLVLLGKRKKGGTKDTITTLCFSARRNDWVNLRPLRNVGEDFACCVHGGSIFVSGGSDGQGSSVYEYTGADDQWTTRKSMLVPLKGHSMVALDSCLYVVGGRSNRTINGQVLEYCLETDFWRLAGEIMAPVENASSVIIGNKIYVFGGTLEDKTPADSVQVYDIGTHDATVFCHLPKPCSFSRSLIRDETAYIVTSDGEVIKLKKDVAEPELVVSIPKFNRINFGISFRENHLNIYGGMGVEGVFADTLLKEVVTVDMTSGDFKVSKPLIPFAYEVHGSAEVVIATTDILFSKKSAKQSPV